MVLAGDSASLLPSSTRLLLKRRELLDVARALQAQREVQAAPSPSVCPLPGERGGRWAQRGQNHRQPLQSGTKPLARPHPVSPGVVFLLGHQHPELHVGASVRGSGARNHPQNEGEQHHGGVSAPVTPRPLPTAQFQDVPSMLAHFGALVGVRAALQQQLEAGQQRLAQGRARLQRYHEEAGGELLRGRDEVLQLRARLEAARHDVLQGESCWTQIQSAAAHKALLLGQIRLAVLSLFQLATKHLRVPRDVALEDTETQLDVVLLCLQDLAAVCAELRPKEPGLGPPRVPAPTTTTRPRHHRAVVGPPSHQ
uniref:Uncharacterized protein n=1 Tax=Cairina moschata TaxID=8855 RepID=A0A8C3D715_CAIMO